MQFNKMRVQQAISLISSRFHISHHRKFSTNTDLQKFAGSMIVRFIVPHAISSVHIGEVSDIFIKPTQPIKKDEVVLIIDTHKCALNEQALVDGVVREVYVNTKQEIKNGHPPQK